MRRKTINFIRAGTNEGVTWKRGKPKNGVKKQAALWKWEQAEWGGKNGTFMGVKEN